MKDLFVSVYNNNTSVILYTYITPRKQGILTQVHNLRRTEWGRGDTPSSLPPWDVVKNIIESVKLHYDPVCPSVGRLVGYQSAAPPH